MILWIVTSYSSCEHTNNISNYTLRYVLLFFPPISRFFARAAVPVNPLYSIICQYESVMKNLIQYIAIVVLPASL